jgi:hypothetical protein
MTDDAEDDYLSDKFLFGTTSNPTPSNPVTYADRRKQAQRQSELKNAQNKIKSRRVREEEAREEGLRTSLFQRAEAEEQELGRKNKAMSMMLKMGFKPGNALGAPDTANENGGASSSDTGLAAVTPPATALNPIGGDVQWSRSGAARTESLIPEQDGGRGSEGPSEESTEASSGLRHRTVPLAVDIRTGERSYCLFNDIF